MALANKVFRNKILGFMSRKKTSTLAFYPCFKALRHFHLQQESRLGSPYPDRWVCICQGLNPYLYKMILTPARQAIRG